MQEPCGSPTANFPNGSEGDMAIVPNVRLAVLRRVCLSSAGRPGLDALVHSVSPEDPKTERATTGGRPGTRQRSRTRAHSGGPAPSSPYRRRAPPPDQPRLSDLVYRQLVADAKLAQPTPADAATEEIRAGPGGHSGATLTSSAADLHTPVIGSSDQPQPEPAHPTLPRTKTRANPRAASAPQPPRRRTGASRWSAPPDERP
jgi:hypothetical protein